MRSRKALLVALLLCTTLWSGSVPPAVAGPSLPNRMAAIGDSITRAANAWGWYGDHPRNSWSTGSSRFDGVRSHYERILAVKPTIAGRNHNDAVSGAKMADAQSQATRAVSQGAQYVTILLGANDACTSSRSTMTSVEDFRAQLQAAMQTLRSGLPNARIFVSSIPNIYRLWRIYHENLVARTVWRLARICQSMLSRSNTEEDRQAVLARVRAFNAVLAETCGQFTNCRFDGLAVFNYPFERRHVSKLDYFHPSLAGQAAIASVTWSASWWPSV
jgi:lysophospholipase L1-like esterase